MRVIMVLAKMSPSCFELSFMCSLKHLISTLQKKKTTIDYVGQDNMRAVKRQVA